MVEDLRGLPPSYPESGEPPTLEQKLVSLAGSLGLVETDEMREIRDTFPSIEPDNENLVFGQMGRYQDLAQQEADKNGSNPKPQIGMSVLTARLYLQIGRNEDYLQTVEDAIMYAQGMGYEDVAAELEGLLPQPEDTGSKQT